MDSRILVTMLGSAALAIFAVFEKSVAMFVSATTIAIIVFVFRSARMRDRVIAIIAAGLGGSIGAEIVYTLYRYSNTSGSTGSDSGSFFMSALLIGLTNTAAIIVVIIATEAWQKFVGRKSR
jgi:hypothetical protein